MATDFFDRQDHARRQTMRLIVLFSLSVAAIIVAIYLLVAIGTSELGPPPPTAYSSSVERYPGYVESPVTGRPRTESFRPKPSLWRPELFLAVSLGTLLVIGVGSLYKISELSAGGESVALMLGGRVVDPQTTDLAERRLLNVVEEMAVASGIPVPPVYVLDNEPSINAFAAGHQPGDAVVAVSAGTLKYLSRAELQGVMGHEFSHILNGDMRLNLRLIGVVHGILILAILGYYIMRFSGTSSENSEKAAAGTFMFGLVLVILGYLGVFFGKLIKSAISRQREFLADASAVQFTRNPGGIAGALKKIGGLTEGSQIHDAHAEEVSHMFFGDAFAGSFFNLFATHPPLADRIRALEPTFDGRFPEVEPLRATPENARRASRVAAAAGFAGETPAPQLALAAAAATHQIGVVRTQDLQHADQIIGDMPPLLLNAAREPFAAQAVIFALLLCPDDEVMRAKQMETLRTQVEPPLFEQTQQLMSATRSLPATARLPLVDLAIPAIKRSSAQQYSRFRQAVDALVAADGKIDLFEYCLRTVLFSYLDVHYGLKKSGAHTYWNIAGVTQPLSEVLLMLAHVGNKDEGQAEHAYQTGTQSLSKIISMLPRTECSLEKFDAALSTLAKSSPKVKREVIGAVAACITADGRVTLEEAELLRAIAAVLACPMPPIAPGM